MHVQKLFIYLLHINTWISGFCRGTTIVGNLTRIIGIPEVTLPVKAVLIPYGGNVKLTCYVTSEKPVSIIWSKNNQQLSVDYKHSNKYYIDHVPNSEDYETLLITIYNVSSGDIGEYRCVANNSYGTVTDVATLYGFVSKETSCVSNEIKTSIEINEIKEKTPSSTGSTLLHCKSFKISFLNFIYFVYRLISVM